MGFLLKTNANFTRAGKRDLGQRSEDTNGESGALEMPDLRTQRGHLLSYSGPKKGLIIVFNRPNKNWNTHLLTVMVSFIHLDVRCRICFSGFVNLGENLWIY